MAPSGGRLEWVPAFASCPCGSSKIHGQCCALLPEKRYLLFTFSDGRSAFVQLSSVKAMVTRKAARPMAEWMLRAAALSVQAALQPSASEYETLSALLIVTTSLEAAVNRLLEPLMKPADWIDFERKSSTQKWSRLYQRVGVKPGLSPDKEPLAALIEIVELRNALVHFKHGKHVRSEEMSVPASWALGNEGGELTLNLPGSLPPMPESPVYGQLAPQRARHFGSSLLAMLDPVLARHQSDEFNVVQNMRLELEQMRRVLGNAESSTGEP